MNESQNNEPLAERLQYLMLRRQDGEMTAGELAELEDFGRDRSIVSYNAGPSVCM